MTGTNNAALYNALVIPFETIDEANAAVEKFFALVEAARKECGIPDVITLVEAKVRHPVDLQRNVAASHYLGSAVNRLPLIARAYGTARAEYEEMLGAAITEGRRLAERG